MQKADGKSNVEITHSDLKIKRKSTNPPTMEIGSQQGQFDLGIECDGEVNGIGMGVLSDGTPFLNQRGLAALCGVQNAHIGYISAQWNDRNQRPRISAIKDSLLKVGTVPEHAHIEVLHKGVTQYCYPAEVCQAVLEYYAFDAGTNCQPEARDNFRTLAGSKLKEMIYAQVGYDPSKSISEPLRKWHERIELNHQSAPRGYFSIFNEAHTVIYELIKAGALVGEKLVPDISIGQHWAKYWKDNDLAERFGKREVFHHRYPDDHPQAKSNPQTANCYPIEALGTYRIWLEEVYLDGGKFATYLKGRTREVPPSVAQLAIRRLSPSVIGTMGTPKSIAPPK